MLSESVNKKEASKTFIEKRLRRQSVDGLIRSKSSEVEPGGRYLHSLFSVPFTNLLSERITFNFSSGHLEFFHRICITRNNNTTS